MTRTFMIAAVLALGTTSSAIAMGCNSHKGQQAMSCADGSSWDSASQTCIPVVSS